MWPRVDPLVSLLAVTAAGWLWGSFLNQLIDRTPRRRREQGWAAPRPVDLLRPVRSLCLHCAATLPWHDNIPIASYLWLRGRCRFCAAPIGRRTLLIEIATPLLFAVWHQIALRRGLGFAASLWGYCTLSWLIVAGLLLWERRRFPVLLLTLGVLLLGGLVTAMLFHA